MGKKNFFINKKGESVNKANFDASVDARIEVDPKAGSWELFMTCTPTKEMLDAVEGNLTDWLKVRRSKAEPFKEGTEVKYDDSKPDYFRLKLPQSSISNGQTETIGRTWLAWRQKFEQTAPNSSSAPAQSQAQSTPSSTQQQTQSTPSRTQQQQSQSTPAQSPSQSQQQQSQSTQSHTQQQAQPTSQPTPKKKYWEMTDEEGISYNEGGTASNLRRLEQKSS